MIRKPIWLDTLLAIAGIAITIAASFDLSGIFPSTSIAASIITLVVGVSLILLVLFRGNGITLETFAKEKLSNHLVNSPDKYDEIIIYNPSTEDIHLLQ